MYVRGHVTVVRYVLDIRCSGRGKRRLNDDEDTHIMIPDVCLENLILLIYIQDLDKAEREVHKQGVRGVDNRAAHPALAVIVVQQVTDKFFLC